MLDRKNVNNIFLGVFELIKPKFHEILFHFPMTAMVCLGRNKNGAANIFEYYRGGYLKHFFLLIASIVGKIDLVVHYLHFLSCMSTKNVAWKPRNFLNCPL